MGVGWSTPGSNREMYERFKREFILYEKIRDKMFDVRYGKYYNDLDKESKDDLINELNVSIMKDELKNSHSSNNIVGKDGKINIQNLSEATLYNQTLVEKENKLDEKIEILEEKIQTIKMVENIQHVFDSIPNDKIIECSKNGNTSIKFITINDNTNSLEDCRVGKCCRKINLALKRLDGYKDFTFSAHIKDRDAFSAHIQEQDGQMCDIYAKW